MDTETVLRVVESIIDEKDDFIYTVRRRDVQALIGESAWHLAYDKIMTDRRARVLAGLR